MVSERGRGTQHDNWAADHGHHRNAVIGALAGVLGELGTPPATLVALATTLAPIRAAIVSEPGVPAR